MVSIDLVLDMCYICFSLVLETGSCKKEILFGNNTTVKGMMRFSFITFQFLNNYVIATLRSDLLCIAIVTPCDT